MIEAISRGCKGTLSDGTLRYVVDISPKDAAAAAELFGMPGSPVVLARLTQAAAIQSAQAETIAEAKPKGGALAKLAGQWCNVESFFDWIRPVYDRMCGGTGSGTGDIYLGGGGDIQTEALFCKHAILVMCDIKSRAELDHDPIAAEKFHRLIRLPYAEYLKING